MRIIVFILFTFYSLSIYSQELIFYLESKGSIGLSGIINSSIPQENQSVAGMGNFGIGASCEYDEKIGLSIEVIFGTHVAKYKALPSQFDPDQTYSSKISMFATQIPMFLRFPNESGYFAFGPQLNIFQGVKYSSSNSLSENIDVGEYYRKTNWSGVIEMARYQQLGRGPVSLLTGVRLNFGLTDIEGVSPEGLPYEFTPEKNKTTILSGAMFFGLIYQLKYN